MVFILLRVMKEVPFVLKKTKMNTFQFKEHNDLNFEYLVQQIIA